MNAEQFEQIMGSDVPGNDYDQCAALLGLNLIVKYLPNSGIRVAEHDQIYACGADELIDAGITDDDAVQLRSFGWFIDEDSLSKFI